MNRRAFFQVSVVSGLALILNPFQSSSQIGEKSLRREIKDLMEKTNFNIHYFPDSRDGEGSRVHITPNKIVSTEMPISDLERVHRFLSENYKQFQKPYESGDLVGVAIYVNGNSSEIDVVSSDNFGPGAKRMIWSG